ncbi:hypothetical protein SCHPADRAFT_909425 [Schizopora paradoxa]|uniref:DUF6741 domain-containing protein n=1 Tax=Schizopora paradoxa TaxID=27342 RepID=A0A0H2R6Q0_9AGAM|nr:hypothetical protein SCHPADRAFT_909425 [Schizopora paradoxa]
MSYAQTATPYSGGYRTPQALARRRSFSGHATSFAYSPRTGYDDYSRYGGYGADGSTGAYDEYAGYGDTPAQSSAYTAQATTSPYPQSAYAGYTGGQGYSTPRQSSYYGNGAGAYDDLAVGTSRYDDYDYGSYPVTSLAPASRRRRSSSISYHNQYSSGPTRTSYYQGVSSYRSTIVKFRAKASFRSGITLAEAVSGVKLSGGDYLRWHEINADARGKIFLRVKWAGYTSLTYEIPVDAYDNRVRLSSLARRVGRACIHFMQANRIQLSWDRVKLYHLEEVSQGTWQPALTIR